MADKKEVLAYFKKRKVFKKLFSEFKKKYESLGRIGGSVLLSGLSKEEKEDLGGFLRKDYSLHGEVKVSAAEFRKSLAGSKFHAFSPEELVSLYFEEDLVSKKEKREEVLREKEDFVKEIIGLTDKSYLLSWLQVLLEGNSPMMRHFGKDREELKRVLSTIIEAIPKLPFFTGKKRELLPVFSAKTTGNPHFFDEGSLAFSLLISFLKEYFKWEGEEGLSEAEYKSELFLKGGIVRDSLSNDVLLYGIRARGKEGELHEGLEGFFRRKEAVKISLFTLEGLEAAFVGEEGERGEVYIVENPAVFAILTNLYPERAFICGNGQLRRAVFKLLDLLTKKSVFYYAGDFDPEGLSIAQKLKLRYGENLILWKYEVGLYLKYKSEVEPSEASLSELSGIWIEELLEIRDAMKREKRAAYQEAMLSEYRIE